MCKGVLRMCLDKPVNKTLLDMSNPIMYIIIKIVNERKRGDLENFRFFGFACHILRRFTQ